MTTIAMNFYERVMLWNLIGNFQAPRLRDAAVLLRVIDKIRPTDVEMTDYQLVSAGDKVRWNLPDSKAGERAVELESEEAHALAGVIEGAENVRVADVQWMMRMVAQLRPEAVARLE